MTRWSVDNVMEFATQTTRRIGGLVSASVISKTYAVQPFPRLAGILIIGIDMNANVSGVEGDHDHADDSGASIIIVIVPAWNRLRVVN